MFKKNWLNLILAISGFIMTFLGMNLVFRNEQPLEYSGIMIGIGSGLLAVGIVSIITKFYYKKHPTAEKQKNIDVQDERNTFIRYKAKSKANDISKWLIFGLSMVTIFAKLPLWITLSILVIYLFNTFLQVYFINKYSK